jgi:hypothetical protein
MAMERVQGIPGSASRRTISESTQDIEDEIKLKIGREMATDKRPKYFAEEVQLHAQLYEAPAPWNHHPLTKTGPYATGAFAETIKLRQSHRGVGIGGGQFLPSFEIYSNSPIAHFLEYGTGVDNPDSQSPWGPNTPTPAFNIFGNTAQHFGGTPDE